MRPENKTILWLIIWIIAFGMGFVHAGQIEATGDSFVRGMNRAGVFLAWQAAALVAAIIAAVVARGVSKEDFPVLRQAGFIPISIMGLGLMTVIIGVLYFSF